MNSHVAHCTKHSAKILLVKSGRQGLQACGCVATEHALYTRSFESRDEIDQTLDHEEFDLVINDVRDQAGDPFFLIERIRQHQASPLILLCPALEPDRIVQAIRKGVSEVLTPPLDLDWLHERSLELLHAQHNGQTPPLSAACWSDLSRFLAEPACPAAETTCREEGLAREQQSHRLAAERLAAERACFEAERAAHINATPAGGSRPPASAVAIRRGADLRRVAAELAAEVTAAEEALAAARTQFDQQRRAQELMSRQQSAALDAREAALAQREQAAAKALAAQATLENQSKRLAQEQHELAAKRREFDELQRNFEAQRSEVTAEQQRIETDRSQLNEMEQQLYERVDELTKKEQAHAASVATFAEQKALLDAGRDAHQKAAEALHQQIKTLHNERAAFDREAATRRTETVAFEERVRAFEETRRKFQEGIKCFLTVS